jgi:AraC-like DNA-binding protein
LTKHDTLLIHGILMKHARFEKIPLLPEQSLSCREFKVTHFATPWHFHPEMELTLIVTGRGLRYVGDSIALFRDGDLVLLGSNLPHYWWKDPADLRRSHTVVVQFRGDLLERGGGWPEAAVVERLFRRAAQGLQFLGTPRRRMVEAIRGLPSLSPWLRLLKLLSILNEPAGGRDTKALSSAGYVPTLDRAGGRRMAAACGYVHERFTERIRQSEAATRAGLSPAAFSRFFHRHMGKTFASYVNEVRIGQVCRLLEDESMTIAEAAFTVGYNNLSNFNRRFRAITGCAPSEFRVLRS